ncbi:MAG: helix-turn-helix transcriptional regulator [Leptolyngbya sp. SIO1E4]|nr:helix-turn-helix transcriptional regulator [Leptolyngbya sp. SIO1E4]
MLKRLVLNHWDDWLQPGSPSDSRLFHADASDRILVCPAHLGQGYFQEILLRDDLSLFIHDHVFDQDLVTDIQSHGDRLEFAFSLDGPDAGYSFLVPDFGWKTFIPKQARKRVFKVEVFCKRPTLITYLQAFLERLSPQSQRIAEHIIQLMYRYHGGGTSSTPVGMLNRIFDRSIAPDPHFIFEQVAPNALYTEMLELCYAARSAITPAMEQVIGQMLSCPYQGATRRTYLEHQALRLIALRLEAIVQSPFNDLDRDCIHQAAAILRKQISHPPTVEALARQVGTNRLKLNQGFHNVYGTTPYGYLRYCRLLQARRLLMISDLAIVEIAAAVGYNNRSHFALAFRQTFGVNPKSFQMQMWQQAS